MLSFLKGYGIGESQTIHLKQGQGYKVQSVSEEAAEPQKNLPWEADGVFSFSTRSYICFPPF